MRRVFKYHELQWKMQVEGVEQGDIAKCIGRSNAYVGYRLRMVDGKAFNIEDAYKIMDFLKLPKEQIFKYFPPNGELARENPMLDMDVTGRWASRR